MTLAEVRCASFGPHLQGWTACSRCGEKLEVEFDGRLLAAGKTDQGEAPEEPIAVNGQSFRLPTTRDLAKAAQEADASLAAVRLVESCRLESEDSPAWTDEAWNKSGKNWQQPILWLRPGWRCAAPFVKMNGRKTWMWSPSFGAKSRRERADCSWKFTSLPRLMAGLKLIFYR